MTDADATNPPPGVTVRPSPAPLVPVMRERFERVGSDDRARQTRRELGLPTDRPVVMTGHQAAWWHPGILAKFLACDAIARCASAAPAWIVPDQDEQDFDTIDIPVRAGADRLGVEAVRVAPPPRPGVPVAALPAFDPPPIELAGEPACPGVAEGLARLRDAIDAGRGAPNAARQIADALARLMAPWIDRAPTIFAASLHRAAAFRDLVARLGDDADRATAAYNGAVATTVHAHTGPLARDPAGGRFELPLWRIRPRQPRVTLWSDELPGVPIEEIAPKALLMTGFLRLACADLFIHGTGGEAYDRATERWFERWLGESLAPMLTVTATLTLPIAADAPTRRDAAAAVWRARHARHHPAGVGLADLQRRRDALVRAVASAPRGSARRAAAFRELHRLLDDYRRSERARLDALDARAASVRERLADAAIAHRRTWAFVLDRPGAIDGLMGAVRDAVCLEPVAR